MTFSSLVQFAGNIGMLAREFGGFLSGAYIFRFLKWMYLKIKKFIFWIIGRKPSTKEQFEEMFQSAAAATSSEKAQNGGQNKGNPTHYSWLSIGFYCFGIMYVIQWIYKTISYELDQKKKMEEQQKLMQQQQQQQLGQGQGMMNPMNPYQQNMYGYPQPAGYGMNGMYGQPMMQQPMQMQPQTQQNSNNPSTKNDSTTDSKGGNGTGKPSESLLAKPKDDTVQNLSG